MDQASYDPLARTAFAEAVAPKTPPAAKQQLTPPPIQRQDSARWYAATSRPPPVKRQVPLGEEFADVAAARANMRSRMVQGACVELNYLFDSPVAGVKRGTKGRVNKRIPGGWLLVKFVGCPGQGVKVRTSNCTLGCW